MHPITAEHIELHRRLGDNRLLRYLLQFAVGETDRALSDLLDVNTCRPSRLSVRLAAEPVITSGTLLTILDPDYPPYLRELGLQAPPFLYIMGAVERLRRPAIAIIGTRSPTSQGRKTAGFYASQFAKSGWNVVSGNAPGIDSAAHRCAIEEGGETMIYPPMPLEMFTPSFRCARALFPRLTVASPFCPGTTVDKWCFLRRNTLVAAHASAALVAETGMRGGTIDTVGKLQSEAKSIFTAALEESDQFFRAHVALIQAGCIAVPTSPTAQSVDAITSAATAQLEKAVSEAPFQHDLFEEAVH
jgi:DNA processing protein